MIKNNTITGTNLVLRAVEESDCTKEYLSWLQDPIINQYLETRWEKQDLSKIKSFVQKMKKSENNFLFAIIEQSSRKHIGNIKLGPVNYYHKYSDISYFVGDKAAWGNGYATEAVDLVTKYGFNRLDLECITAGVYEFNIASQRVLEKVGYSLQGRITSQLLNIHGNREDHFFYCINRSDYDQ